MQNKQRHTIRYNAGGFAMPVLVSMMVVMVLVGYGMLSLGYNARIQAVRQTEDVYAVAAAEAGITHAIMKMNRKLIDEDQWENTSLFVLNTLNINLPNCDAKYNFNIVGSPSTGFVISSTGISGSKTRTFYALTLLGGVFDYGILVKDKLEFDKDTIAFGFSSQTNEKNLMTIIATAATEGKGLIDLKNTTVFGDVMVGPGGDTNKLIKDCGVVTGIVDAMTNLPEFPDVKVPSDLMYKGSIKSGMTLTGTPGSGKYGELKLEKNDSLVIVGDVKLYITGDVELKDDSQIRFSDKTPSSLTLYVDGDFEIKDDAVIDNKDKKAENFRLFGSAATKQEIEIKSEKADYDFYGAVYAPNAKIEIDITGDIYGSFVSDTFNLESASNFYHDVSLTNDVDSEGAYFGIGRWYEP